MEENMLGKTVVVFFYPILCNAKKNVYACGSILLFTSVEYFS